jgi:hypothetical protein
MPYPHIVFYRYKNDDSVFPSIENTMVFNDEVEMKRFCADLNLSFYAVYTLQEHWEDNDS